MFFARLRWPKIHHFPRCLVDEEQIFVRMRLLFPTIMVLLFHGVSRTLAAAFCPVNGQGRGALEGEGTAGHLARVAFRGQAERGEGLL